MLTSHDAELERSNHGADPGWHIPGHPGHFLPEVLLRWDGMQQLAGMNYHPAAADGGKTGTVTLP